MEIPLISVITVVYNGVCEIEATIKSVVDVNSTRVFEYIIVDGGSTDGTLEVIKKYDEDISRWVSEPDKGVYDAMNKAILMAKGKYLYFINCGDVLLEIPYEIIQNNNQADLLCFPVKIGNDGVRYPTMNIQMQIRNLLPHQGIFYKKQNELYYEVKYKVFADFALNLDYYKKKKKILVFRLPVVASHSLNGVSNNPASAKEFFDLIKEKNGFLSFVLSFFYFKLRGLAFRFLK